MSAWEGPSAALRAAVCAALCASVALWAAPVAAAPAASARRAAHGRSSTRTIPVAVEVSRTPTGPPVPQGFLGLSFELAALPEVSSDGYGGDLVTLMRSLGAGVLRFGGITADEQVAWAESSREKPAWASGTIDAEDLWKLRTLVSQTGWHVLLTLGLGHFEPQAAAREAAVAKIALGEWLEAIELGNEPDSFARHGLRALPWTVVQYSEQVAEYLQAIDAAAPGIPLAGPDVSGSSAFEKWGPAEAVDQKPVLLTGHHYPLACVQVPPASIGLLLSPHIRELEEVSLDRYLLVAGLAETPFRLDETNTVSCGGVAGISNTFASALWAVAYLTRAMTMGVAGVNLEGNPVNCGGYTPLCAPSPEALASGALEAQPEWYALLLLAHLIGDRPVALSVDSPDHANVVVSAFVAPDGTLRVVFVNDDPPGDQNVRLRLRAGAAYRGATILALTAPAPAAPSGVTLGGRGVTPNGSWTAMPRLPRARNRRGIITVAIAPSSAVLLTIDPKR